MGDQLEQNFVQTLKELGFMIKIFKNIKATNHSMCDIQWLNIQLLARFMFLKNVTINLNSFDFPVYYVHVDVFF